MTLNFKISRKNTLPPLDAHASGARTHPSKILPMALLMSEMENMGDTGDTKFVSEIRCPNFTKSAFVSEDVDSDSFSINVANKSMKCNFLHVSCQEIATKSPQNRLEIVASLHARFGIAA